LVTRLKKGKPKPGKFPVPPNDPIWVPRKEPSRTKKPWINQVDHKGRNSTRMKIKSMVKIFSAENHDTKSGTGEKTGSKPGKATT